MKSESTWGDTTPVCSNHCWCDTGGKTPADRAEGWEGLDCLLHRGTVLGGQCQAFALYEHCDLWEGS